MRYSEAKKIVQAAGMAISDDGVAFTVCGGQLVNGEKAPPNIAAMNGWTVDEVAAELTNTPTPPGAKSWPVR
jgi:hypothetical protein